jgi:translation initiation factor 1
MSDEKTKLVYSTDKAIPRKEKPVEKALPSSVRPSQQKVTVRLERKGRGGKSVTVIEGLQMPQKEREALLKQLKAELGTGGTVKDTTLEIQGAHCDALMASLEKMGYTPKRSGS